MKNSINLLVIEDNPAYKRLLMEMLGEISGPQGRLIACESLSQTLKILSENSFDLIILDLFLPDSQGLESLIRLQNSVGELPIIVLTGFEDSKLAEACLQAGAVAFLVKDQVDSTQLHSLIKKLVI